MTKQDNTKDLTKLGSKETDYQYGPPDADFLETFPNQFPGRKYITEYVFDEFTSLCPKTGQPDFAIISLKYIPDELCIETKSLKLYYLAYRQHGSFMETITNQILDDCVAACSPIYMEVVANFNKRGGTDINVTASYRKGEE